MSVQELTDALQKALGLSVTSGQIVLNLSEKRVQSVETKTFHRVASTARPRIMGPPLDKAARWGA